MARTFVKSLPDRTEGILENVTFDLAGRLFLTPDNVLAQDGDPRYVDSGVPGTEDGFNVYAGLSPQRMIRQNDRVIPLRQPSFQWTYFEEDGHVPPAGAEANPSIGTPKTPVLKIIDAVSAGYQTSSTQYAAAFSGVDDAGKHTMLSPFSFVPTFSADGTSFRVPFPQDLPGEWDEVGFWLSIRNGTKMYLQEVIDISGGIPPSYEYRGPFRSLRTAPLANETYLGSQPQPKREFRDAPYGLRKGAYEIRAVLVTASGTTLSDPIASQIVVAGDRAKTRIAVLPPPRRGAAVGWYCLVRQTDGRYYICYPVGSNPLKPLGFDQGAASVYSTDPEQWPTDGKGSPVGWAVELYSLPTTDTSGLPDPQDPMDVPETYIATGLHDASAGTRPYYVALTKVMGGVEGPRGKAATTGPVAPGKACRVVIPKDVQKLKNAEQTETGTDGLPLDWTVDTTGGTATSEPGQTRVTVNQGTTQATPTVTTSLEPIDFASDYRIGGEVEIIGYVSGEVRAFLREYTAAGVFIRETPIAFESGNAFISGNGAEEFDMTIRAADGPFWSQAPNPVTAFAAVQVRTPPTIPVSARNLTYVVRDAGVHPHEHKPIKRRKGDRARGEVDDQNPTPDTAFTEGADFVVGKPKRKKKPQAGRQKPLNDRPTIPGTVAKTYDFEAGENRPSLQLTRTPADAYRVSEFVAPPVGMSGTLAWHVQDSGTGANAANAKVLHAETFSGTRTSIGVQLQLNIASISSGSCEILHITDLVGLNVLGVLRVESNRDVTFLAMNRDGSVADTTVVASGNAATDVLTLDLVAQGGGQKDGLLRCWVSKNGGERIHMADAEGLDWGGVRPQRYAFGIVSESGSTTLPNLYFDSVTVTEEGILRVREHDPQGNVVYQGTYVTPPGHPVRQNVLPRNFRYAVKPGQSYSIGIFLRYAGVKGIQKPFFLTLHRLDGGVVPVGCMLGQAGVTGTAPWREYALNFAVPSDCYEMRISGHDIGVGKYVFQELCLSEALLGDVTFTAQVAPASTLSAGIHGLVEGSAVRVRNVGGGFDETGQYNPAGALPAPLSEQATYYVRNPTLSTLQLAGAPGGAPIPLSSAGSGTNVLVRSLPRRTGKRAAQGRFPSPFDTDTPLRGSYGPAIPRRWKRAGVVIESQPQGTAFDLAIRSSSERGNEATYSQPTGDVSTLARRKYIEIGGTLSGDGVETPVVSGDSPYLEQELEVATLLRADGSEFPGGTIILDAQAPSDIPPVNVTERLDRRIERQLLAAPVGNMAAFKVQVFTEAAKVEIEQRWMLDEFLAEFRGRSVRIKPREQITVKQTANTQRRAYSLDGQTFYYVYGVGEASACEVVEAALL